MPTYSITGNCTYCESDETEDGYAPTEIDETIIINELSARTAFERFFAENTQYSFMGQLNTCDAETGGRKGATYVDQNESHTINVDLIDA